MTTEEEDENDEMRLLKVPEEEKEEDDDEESRRLKYNMHTAKNDSMPELNTNIKMSPTSMLKRPPTNLGSDSRAHTQLLSDIALSQHGKYKEDSHCSRYERPRTSISPNELTPKSFSPNLQSRPTTSQP